MSRITLLLAAVLLAACAAVTRSDDAPGATPPGAVELDEESGAVDMACARDSDCVVKNVGNCCGYFPACVNRDSETFPERVKLQCEKEGRSSVCGFREITSCICVEGQCAAGDGLR